MSEFDVLQERITALKSENDLVHEQLAQQISNVSQMLVEERRRTNGSLDKLGIEMQRMRETFEEKINVLSTNINDIQAQVAVLTQSRSDWKNSYIITFLSTLCGILMSYVITMKFFVR